MPKRDLRENWSFQRSQGRLHKKVQVLFLFSSAPGNLSRLVPVRISSAQGDLLRWFQTLKCCVTLMDAQHDGTEHVSTAIPDAKPERDLALKHMDGSKANYVFKEKTLRNLRPKFDVPEHRLGHCPVNEAMWRNLYEFLCVGCRALQQGRGSTPTCSSKHGCPCDQERVHHSAQNQIHSLKEREWSGLQGQLDWDESPWKSCTLAHDDIYN